MLKGRERKYIRMYRRRKTDECNREGDVKQVRRERTRRIMERRETGKSRSEGEAVTRRC